MVWIMKLQDFEAKLDKKVRQLFENSIPEYYEHALKVVSNVKNLAKSSSIDKKLLLAAAYLHDIGYSIPYRDGFVGEIEDQNLKIRVHCRRGPELTRNILGEMDVKPSIVDRVAYLVKVHHKTDPDDEDLQLLIAADRLAADEPE